MKYVQLTKYSKLSLDNADHYEDTLPSSNIVEERERIY